ncbi:MAG: Crp/Fnr family transcriptional regulator [Novosphingobium sp.]|uniref:Crp/Fnr family transcriptional regulator n=1 Tax=Novosphingobium sp. TaxID=1874826 RepID=UPI0032BD49E9
MAHPDDLTILRAAFGCGEALAATIAGLGRAAGHTRGAVLWPRDGAADGTGGSASLLTLGHAAELAYGRDGAVLVLHALVQGEMFGDLAGSGQADGGARVEALSEGRAIHFAASVMVRLMESYPLVALALARHLSARIAAMRQRMVETALLSSTGRIAAELLRMANAGGGTIRPVPVMTELALKVQAARETVSRTVSSLEKRGVLRRVDGGLELAAPHRLEELIY